MSVEVIDNLQALDQVKDVWRRIYEQDEQATFFMSWDWLRPWLEITDGAWQILAISKNGEYQAFLPLRQHIHRRFKIHLNSRFESACKPNADYISLLCLPEAENDAIPELGCYLKTNLRWDVFLLEDVLDNRLSFLFQHLIDDDNAFLRQVGQVTSPAVELPGSWEEYLAETLGYDERREVRRRLRKLDATHDLHFEDAQTETLDCHIEALLNIWESRWGKLSESCRRHRAELFRKCFHAGALWLPLLYFQDTPIAALAVYVDSVKRSAHAYMTGYNPEFSKFSPGRVLHDLLLKRAIHNKFVLFDFLRGREKYKYEYGAKDRFCISMKAVRTSVGNTARKWVSRTLEPALQS